MGVPDGPRVGPLVGGWGVFAEREATGAPRIPFVH